MQYVYALNPVCIVLIIPDTPAEKFPVRLWTYNPEYNDIYQRHTLININNKEISTHCLACLIFYTYDSANFKKHRE